MKNFFTRLLKKLKKSRIQNNLRNKLTPFIINLKYCDRRGKEIKSLIKVISNNKGFSLIEVLIVVFILSFTSLAILKTLDISLLSSNLSNSLVSDADLKTAIHHVLKPDQCERNLHPDKLTNVNTNSKTVSLLKKYKDPADPSNQEGAQLIKSGETFRDYLDIIKIELAGPETDIQREFKVYYKRKKVKHLSTRENNVCNSTDQSGCYVNTCNIEYETHTVGAVTSVTTCTVLNCFNITNSQSPDCYTVDKSDETLLLSDVNAEKKGRTLIGCGGTNNIEKSGTVAFGFGAGMSNTTGHSNTFIGYRAGHSNTTGSNNIFLGREAGKANTGGDSNTFLGHSAGHSNTTGSNNIFLGREAGRNNTTGLENVFIGYRAGYLNTTGGSNTFLGREAGTGNTTGHTNTFLGHSAGRLNTTGKNNTFLGFGAGSINTTGELNTFLGHLAGHSNTEGNFNIFLGQSAGYSNYKGDSNTFLGFKAGHSNTTGNNNIFLGNQAGDTADYVDKDNKFVIGNNLHRVWITGTIGTTTFKINNRQVSLQGSSRTLKKNIKVFKDYNSSLKNILNTPLYTYEYKDDLPDKKRMGYISEDLPKSLQILEKGEVSRPDMPSIYGTLWASIKALYFHIKDFQKGVSEKFKVVLKELKDLTPVVKNNEKVITEIQTEIKALKEANKQIKAENKKLKQKIDKILKNKKARDGIQ